MHCPKCKSTQLAPTKLEPQLAALGCKHCHGALISLLYYRDWAERTFAEPKTTADQPRTEVCTVEELNDSKTALHCPKCGKIMRKFRINGQQDNRLDMCTSCDEAWVDGGEWQLLKSLELDEHMPAIFTEHWQKRVRDEATEEAKKARFTRQLGEEDFAKADTFKQWLKNHPKRQEILFYCNG